MFKKTLSLGLLSKHRNAIYGFSILWVVLFHADNIDKVRFLFDEPGFFYVARTIGMGNVAVDIFLFLSGVSLFFAFSKNSDVIGFYKKRLLRIIPAVWIIFGIGWLRAWLVKGGSFLVFISRMTVTRFWIAGEQSIWFVSLIVALYLLFPLIYKWIYLRPNGAFVRCCALLAITYLSIFALQHFCPEWTKSVNIALLRIPVFMMGCYAGKFVRDQKKVSSIAFVILVIAGIILFFSVIWTHLLATTYQKRLFYALGGISLAFGLALLFEACEKVTKNPQLGLLRFFSWFGGFSLELYLAHIKLNHIMRAQAFYIEGDAVQYTAMACCAVVLAWTVNRLVNYVLSKIAQRHKAVGRESA